MLPGVVIGIGGTGKWVNTYIKKRLGGEVPDELRLLCFDLIEEDELTPVVLPHFDPRRGESVVLKLDYGQGDTPEFYNFAEYWARTIDDIKHGSGNKYPAINDWLDGDAQYYNLAASQKDTKGGGGQLRQSTRVSLSLKATEIYQRVRTALRAMVGRGTDEKRIQVFIVASLAGGTGCGTLLDIAFFVHQAVTEIGEANLPILPVGILLLPRGFDGVRPNERERRLQAANCFAAFRELHRFNFVHGMTFRYQSGITAALGNKRPFDLCYYIDGTSVAGISGSDVPHYRGTCPAIADFILLSLGEQTSSISIYKNLTTNISNALSGAEPAPFDAAFYSTLGIHEYRLDTEELRRAFGLKIEVDLLNYIVEGPFAGDVNAELQKDFIKSRTTDDPDGGQLTNSGFNTVLVTGLLEQNVGALHAEFLKLCFNLPGQPDALPIVDLSGIDRGALLRPVSFDRVRDEADTAAGQVYRQFSENLDRLAATNREAIADWLRGWLAKCVLNADNRRGSLARAEAFLLALQARYAAADKKLKELYAALGLANRIAQSDSWLAEYVTRKRKKEYVDELEQKVRWQQLDDLANKALDLAGFAIGQVEQCLRQVRAWSATLIEGRKKAESAARALAAVRLEERNVKVRTYVTTPGDDIEAMLYDFIVSRRAPDPNRPVQGEINAKLPHVAFNSLAQQFRWRFAGDELECHLPAEFSPMQVFRDDWLLWNYNFVGNYLEQGQLKALDELSAADVLLLKGVNGQTLANELLQKAGTLAAFDSTVQQAVSGGSDADTSTAEWKFFYFDAGASGSARDLLEEAKKTLQASGFVGLPNFTDRRRIVIWQAQHFIKPAGFTNLASTETTYRAGVVKNDPAPLHVLPGERAAAAVEDAFPTLLYCPPHCLHPRVVSLLDNAEALKPFLYALDFPGGLPIAVKVVGGVEKFVFRLMGGRELELAPKADPVGAATKLLGPEPEFVQARKELAAEFDKFLNGKLANKPAFLAELKKAAGAITFSPDARDALSDFARLRKVMLLREAERFA